MLIAAKEIHCLSPLTVAEDTMIDGVLLDQALIEHVVAAADIA